MGINKTKTLFIVLVAGYCLLFAPVNAELLERVVAIVNDDVILLSEFRNARDANLEKTDIEVLNEMIDRRLLLKEAERYMPRDKAGSYSQKDDDALIKKYINRRIRPFIHIPIGEIESYYIENKGLFRGREFYEVKDEVEAQLIEEAVKQRLGKHLKKLRKKAYIRIQLEGRD